MSETPPPLPGAESEVPKPTQARRLALAFMAVFGEEKTRTSDQRLVVKHMRAMCGRDAPIFQQDKNGNFDAMRAAHIDGAQTQFLIIKRQLALAIKVRDDEKPKPKSKR